VFASEQAAASHSISLPLDISSGLGGGGGCSVGLSRYPLGFHFVSSLDWLVGALPPPPPPPPPPPHTFAGWMLGGCIQPMEKEKEKKISLITLSCRIIIIIIIIIIFPIYL